MSFVFFRVIPHVMSIPDQLSTGLALRVLLHLTDHEATSPSLHSLLPVVLPSTRPHASGHPSLPTPALTLTKEVKEAV